jgi:hypothetical protein
MPRDLFTEVIAALEYRLSISAQVSLKTLDDDLLPQLQEAASRYIVDLSDLGYLVAPDAVNLLLLLGYLERISQEQPILIPPSDTRVMSFLSNVRFFVMAENLCLLNKVHPIPPPVDSRVMAKRNILEIKQIVARQTEEGFYNWLGRQIANTVIEKFSKLAGGRYAYLTEVFLELCKNIFEHSGSLGYIAAQVYPPESPSSEFHITVGDLGIGLFDSLVSYYKEDNEEFERKHGPIWDEAKALDLAFAPGVSSKKNSNQTRGIGLPTVLGAVKRSGGSLVCRTGTSKAFLGYWRHSWRTERKVGLAMFPGTQLEVRMPVGR